MHASKGGRGLTDGGQERLVGAGLAHGQVLQGGGRVGAVVGEGHAGKRRPALNVVKVGVRPVGVLVKVMEQGVNEWHVRVRQAGEEQSNQPLPLRRLLPLRKRGVEAVDDPARQRRAIDALGRVRGRQDGHAVGVARVGPCVRDGAPATTRRL